MPRFILQVHEETTYVVEAADEKEARSIFELSWVPREHDVLERHDTLIAIEPE